MAGKFFVNLPVKDLDAAMAFYAGLGYHFNPQFTDDNAACLVISEDVFVMLLVEPYFTTFTGKPVPDASAGTRAIIALSQDSTAEVDRIGDAALAGGGTPAKATEQGSPMYTRSFYDLDGHHWEIFHMDLAGL